MREVDKLNASRRAVFGKSATLRYPCLASVAASRKLPGEKDAKRYSLPGARQQTAAGAGQTVSARYLRAAQAYMLISMPTGTSTIFGVFQLIEVLPRSMFGTMPVPDRN